MKLILFVLLLLQCCGNTNSTNTESNFDSNTEKVQSSTAIPVTVNDYIINNLKDYRIPTTKDYFKEISNFVEKEKLPYYCSSDFDGDGYKDCGIVLIKANMDICLLVIHNIDQISNHTIINCFGKFDNELDLILGVEKKGKWDAATDSIIVPNDGIFVEFAKESKGHAYYWNKESYIKFLFD